MVHYDTKAFKHATTRSGYGDPRTVIVDPPAEPKTKSKKNTRKWCKGVVGREHQWAWVYRDVLPNSSRGRGEYDITKFTEPPLLTVEQEAEETKLQGGWHIPRAAHVCLVCMKQRDWWTNSFTLRRQGIEILTQMPESS